MYRYLFRSAERPDVVDNKHSKEKGGTYPTMFMIISMLAQMRQNLCICFQGDRMRLRAGISKNRRRTHDVYERQGLSLQYRKVPPFFSTGYAEAIAKHCCAKPTISMITKTVEPRRANRSSFYLGEIIIESVLALRASYREPTMLMKAKGVVRNWGFFTQSKTLQVASLHVASSLASSRLRHLADCRKRASVTLSVTWAFGPWGFYIWIHSGLQLITALSEGYGEARAGVVFLAPNQRIPHPCRMRDPPSPASWQGLLSTHISPSDQNVQTPGAFGTPNEDESLLACFAYSGRSGKQTQCT